MRIGSILVLTSVLIAASKPARGREAASRCTMVTSGFMARNAATTYVLGRPALDTISVRIALRTAADSFRYRHRAAVGQLIHVDSLLGREENAVRQRLRGRASNDIIVLPWMWDMGCGPIPWMDPRPYFAVDSQTVLFLALRPESLWVGDIPTFDALEAPLRTYRNGQPGPQRSPGDTTLTLPNVRALDYFTLIRALPEGDAPPDSAAIARVRGWVAGHPDARRREPSLMVLQYWDRVLN